MHVNNKRFGINLDRLDLSQLQQAANPSAPAAEPLGRSTVQQVVGHSRGHSDSDSSSDGGAPGSPRSSRTRALSAFTAFRRRLTSGHSDATFITSNAEGAPISEQPRARKATLSSPRGALISDSDGDEPPSSPNAGRFRAAAMMEGLSQAVRAISPRRAASPESPETRPVSPNTEDQIRSKTEQVRKLPPGARIEEFKLMVENEFKKLEEATKTGPTEVTTFFRNLNPDDRGRNAVLGELLAQAFAPTRDAIGAAIKGATELVGQDRIIDQAKARAASAPEDMREGEVQKARKQIDAANALQFEAIISSALPAGAGPEFMPETRTALKAMADHLDDLCRQSEVPADKQKELKDIFWANTLSLRGLTPAINLADAPQGGKAVVMRLFQFVANAPSEQALRENIKLDDEVKPPLLRTYGLVHGFLGELRSAIEASPSVP